MQSDVKTVSIIIPTYNRAKSLRITIESFIEQNYPKDKYEIIIADNNSSDNTRDVVNEWQAKSSLPIKYIFEKRQGVHYTRNSAAKIAKGHIFYYTDDDMIADPNLLKEIVKPFMLDSKVATATGRVLPKWEQPPPKWILNLCNNFWLSLHDRKEDLIISTFDCGVISCHQAIKRDVFFKSGGFNPENTAGEWIGDGETGLNIKIKDLGYKFAFIRSSLIYHIIPPSRMTQKYLNKRLANQGNCDSYTGYKKYIYTNWMLYKKILSHVKNLIKNLMHVFFSFVLNKGRWRINRAYVSYYSNRIKYDFRLTKDKHWRQLVLKNDWLNE